MPYSRATRRRPAQHIVTLDRLTEVNHQVTCEMDKLGLWCDALDDVDVYLVPASAACYGWHLGHIHVPAVSGAQLYDLVRGSHTRLSDVLRHEWAHAIADRCPKLVLSRKFERVFGGNYNLTDSVHDYDPAHHLTEYAATMPCEDFAETFHFFLRHKGRLSVRLQSKPVIVRKWEFFSCATGRHHRYA